jgi:hypothetical protein
MDCPTVHSDMQAALSALQPSRRFCDVWFSMHAHPQNERCWNWMSDAYINVAFATGVEGVTTIQTNK